VNNPGVFEIEMVKNTFRDLIYDPQLGGGVIDDKKIKAIIPAASRPRGSVRTCWTCPSAKTKSRRRDRCSARVRSS